MKLYALAKALNTNPIEARKIPFLGLVPKETARRESLGTASRCEGQPEVAVAIRATKAIVVGGEGRDRGNVRINLYANSLPCVISCNSGQGGEAYESRS